MPPYEEKVGKKIFSLQTDVVEKLRLQEQMINIVSIAQEKNVWKLKEIGGINNRNYFY